MSFKKKVEKIEKALSSLVETRKLVKRAGEELGRLVGELYDEAEKARDERMLEIETSGWVDAEEYQEKNKDVRMECLNELVDEALVMDEEGEVATLWSVEQWAEMLGGFQAELRRVKRVAEKLDGSSKKIVEKEMGEEEEDADRQ